VIARMQGPAALILILVLGWHLASVVYGRPRVLPGPTTVAAVLKADASGLARLSFVSASRALGGLLLASGVAAILALALALFPASSTILYPAAVLVKATPAVAFAPILIALVGSGWKVKVAIAASIAFFPMLIASLDSVRLVPAELHLLGAAYGASRLSRLRHIQVGWLAYGFTSGLRTAAPLAVVGAIVAEFVDSSRTTELGIGSYLFNAARNDFMPQVFAAAVVCGLLGLTLFAVSTALNHVVARVVHLDKENG
jgi:NitT/TauT family transport system permease protein